LGNTGSGRQIADCYAGTDSTSWKLFAHATAAPHFDPDVETIFEIGWSGVPNILFLSMAFQSGLRNE
jgi:activator of 2-hydroxyglutaryl-CoA dehydratase